VTFGGMDPARFDPKTLITVKNKSRLGFWEAPLDAIHVNGEDLGWGNRTLILDTGTVSIFVFMLRNSIFHLILFKTFIIAPSKASSKMSMILFLEMT
jgi:hypothetical protein